MANNDYSIYNDPIRITWRKGDSKDPYIPKTEDQKIINNVIVLSEVPDEFTHVAISGYTEIYGGSPKASQFIVNYQNGMITFNATNEGAVVTATYMGRGFIQYPAERIYSHNDNPNVVTSLQDIIGEGENALNALSQLTVVVADSQQATNTANLQAGYAKAQGDYAKAQGDNANTATTQANNAAVEAGSKAVLANTATTNANTATIQANTARDNANSAATNANTAAAANTYKKDSAIPTSGTWKKDDVVYNSSPLVGESLGWVCTDAGVSGSPNTGFLAKITSAFGGGLQLNTNTFKIGDRFIVDGSSRPFYTITGNPSSMGAGWYFYNVSPVTSSEILTNANVRWAEPIFQPFGKNSRWDDGIVDIGDRLSTEVNDDGRMARAIDKALTFPSFGTIRLRANDQLVLTKTINIDASLFGIVGHMTILNFTGLTDPVAINIYASIYTETDPAKLVGYTSAMDDADDYARMYKAHETALANVIVIGSYSNQVWDTLPQNYKTGIVLGHDTHKQNAMFEVSQVTIQGFGNGGNMKFKSNAWRISLDRIFSRWGKNFIPVGLQNFGENLHFTRCQFEGSNGKLGTEFGWEIGTGSTNFQHCSFDNCNILINGDSTNWFSQCHFERPGSTVSTSYRLSITNKEASAILDNCLIVPPGSSVTDLKDPMFFVDDTNIVAGLVFNSCKFFTVSTFKPYWNAKKQVMVGGKGRVQINNYISWFNPTSNPSAYVISEYLNAIHNGDIEAGNTNGWTVNGTGTLTAIAPPAFSTAPDSTDARYGKTFGNFCLSLASPTGVTTSAYQEFDVKPGQQFLATYWRKAVIAGTGTFTRELKFYSKTGVELLATTPSTISASSDWNISYSNMSAIAPMGAATVRLIFTSVGNGGTTTGYIDDVIVNII